MSSLRSVGLFAAIAVLAGFAVSMPAAAGVRFDVPQIVEAVRIDTCCEPGPAAPGDEISVAIELNVSIIVDSLDARRIEQLLVEIIPRGGSAIITDYAPRTELGSDYESGIEVEDAGESHRSIALGVDAGYPPIGGGNLGATRGEKKIASMRYSRAAPLHLIAASGTTNRGRGAYFKFRGTDRQIIEGDRLLQLTFRVPATWRGELLEVRITGESRPRGFSAGVASLAGWSKPERVGSGRFLVAAYRGDDPQAKLAARGLADAEAVMRRRLLTVTEAEMLGALNSPTALVRHISYRVDLSGSADRMPHPKATLSLHRALEGSLNPHVDREFKDLPADARAAVLDYLERRRHFVQLTS